MLFPFFARGQGRFTEYDFSVKGDINDVITEDLNGDGLKELIAIHTDTSTTPPTRFITIFWQGQSGFDVKNKYMWRVPPEVAATDVGDVAAEPGRELVFITEKGIYYAGTAGGKVGELKQIFKTQSVVAIAYDRSVPYYNFVRDYTGDGKDDILVCGFYDALVARQVDGYQFVRDEIQLRPGMEIMAFDMHFMTGSQEHPLFRVAYYVPRVFSEDANGDGLVDLIANFRNEVYVFAQGPEGFIAAPAKHYSIKIYEEEPSGRRQGQFPNIEFADLDGDRKMDMVASQMKGDFGNMQSKTYLYLGKSDGAAKNKPDLVFNTVKPAFGVYIHDVNKDGLLDLVMPTFDINLWNTGKVLVTGDITVEWDYFVQKKDRSFSADPDRVVPTNLKFNIGKFRLESGIPNVFGDFNGDGYPDQALGESKDVLVITLRDGLGNVLPISERITVPVSIITRAADLNNDGLSDLEIHYMEDPEHASELRVFINKGPWNQ